MQLASGARREVIEDLLDINIFSKMNGLLKEKMSILREDIKDNGHQIEMVKTKINAQKKYLRDLSAVNTAYRKEKEDKISAVNAEIDTLQEQNAKLSQFIVEKEPPLLADIEKNEENRKKLSEFSSTFKTQIKSVVKEAKFFEENEHCPTCDQHIEESLREQKKDKAYKRAKELNTAMNKAEKQSEEYDSLAEAYEAMMTAIRNKQNDLNNNNQTISRLQKNITDLQKEIESLSDTSSDMSKANEELETLNGELFGKQDEKYKLNEQYSYNQVSAELLKDTGIKTKIIKQYIPVINKLTNQYLQTLDFFVHFDLDESFNETIRSRFRDNFSYDSFSEGEKQRIDLSLLFTWRQIAKMKNSVATNLLILDETFDSSLDDDGVDNLMKILYSLGEETNVFVISHKAELEDAQFQRRLEFVKDKNFSKLKAA
jgi:DNA repair exonuclease SbcCD ATPase subunit